MWICTLVQELRTPRWWEFRIEAEPEDDGEPRLPGDLIVGPFDLALLARYGCNDVSMTEVLAGGRGRWVRFELPARVGSGGHAIGELLASFKGRLRAEAKDRRPRFAATLNLSGELLDVWLLQGDAYWLGREGIVVRYGYLDRDPWPREMVGIAQDAGTGDDLGPLLFGPRDSGVVTERDRSHTQRELYQFGHLGRFSYRFPDDFLGRFIQGRDWVAPGAHP
jgi:hypothetical protein